MKKILAIVIALLATLPTFAQTGEPGRHTTTVIKPKGELKYYKMNCIIRDLTGLVPVMDVANKVYFDEDGETIYIGSLFPAVLQCDQLYAKAKFNKDHTEAVIDCEDIVFINEESDADGNMLVYQELRIGELVTDEKGDPTGYMDHVHFKVDGDKIYLDYSKYPMRTLVLYEVTTSGEVGIVGINYNNTLTRFTGNTDLVTPPATAKYEDYIYTGMPSLGDTFTFKGQVAVDGDDYYFNGILPELVGKHWIKGTRKGNTITLKNNQFLGIETSYYLYYNGLTTSGSRDDSGNYKGTKTEITLNIDDNGVITFAKPNQTGAFAYYISGNQYIGTFQLRAEPYKGDVHGKPSHPYDLKLVTTYFEKYGECSLSFVWDNKTEKGEYINPDKLWYNFYVDDDIYTFVKDVAHEQYPYIDGDQMTDIPFGYKDAGNYDLYRADDGRDVVCFREDLFNKVGVQAVYRVDGKEYRSDIAFIYFDNSQEVVPAGLHSVTADENEGENGNRLYDLQGRQLSATNSQLSTPSGLYIKGGKLILKK